MNALPAWLRRVAGLLAIAGGGVGLTVSLAEVLSGRLDVLTSAVVVAFAALYAFGVYVGMRALEAGPQSATPLFVFYLLQVPYVSTPWLSYRFASGANAHVLLSAEGATANWTLGSQFNFALFQVSPVALGCNLVAVVICVFVWNAIRQHAPSTPPPAAVPGQDGAVTKRPGAGGAAD